MKTIFAASLALLVGGIVGCGWSGKDKDNDRNRDARDEQPMSKGGDKDDATRIQSDPVCGHTVNPRNAAKAVYGTETYYFHNEKCADKFRDNPHAYLPGGDDRDLDRDGRDRDLDRDGRRDRDVR